MKLVIIGGTGLIGSKLVTKLREQGHEAVAASPATGVNMLTGEGLDEALQGASVVVDVSNSASFEEKAVMEFFTTSTRNLLNAEAGAGVVKAMARIAVGAPLNGIVEVAGERTLVPGANARLGEIRFTEWVGQPGCKCN